MIRHYSNLLAIVFAMFDETGVDVLLEVAWEPQTEKSADNYIL